MVEARVPLKAAQERLGHSRPDILLGFYAHVLDASADMAAATMSGHWEADFRLPWPLMLLISLGLFSNWLPYWRPRKKPSPTNRCKLLRKLEARVGIEPTHKGFAVLAITSKQLKNWAFFRRM